MGNFIYRDSFRRKTFNVRHKNERKYFVLVLVSGERVMLTGSSEASVRASHDSHEKVLEKSKFRYKIRGIKDVIECDGAADANRQLRIKG